MLIKASKPTKSVILFEKSDNEKSILRPSDAENVSNMSQSVQNIIINDHKHILDLNKSYKGHLQKNPGNPFPKNGNSQIEVIFNS